jgi:predicted metal-dependent phosphoesterase TrpH
LPVTLAAERMLRADLHIHTRHSRLGTLPVLGARDCYSTPREAYLRAKARGMDLVTFTDHDTIDGCLELLSERGDLPDFFISEEVSVRDHETGIRLHVSVYGIDEAVHREVQRLRGDARELVSYLNGKGIAACLNHLGSSLTGKRAPLRDLLALAASFPLVETCNGAEGSASNGAAADLAGAMEAAGIAVGRTGGSDAHTLRRIGSVWTEAVGENRASFLEALRGRRIGPGGSAAGLWPMVQDIYEVVFGYYGDLAVNRHHHFVPSKRWKAAACAGVSLPLHLVALPALGTVFRRIRVRSASLACREALKAKRHSLRPGTAADEPRELPRHGTAEGTVVAWVPRPGSEEA